MNITPYAISKKLNKPAQVVYKKIDTLLKKPPCENIDEHIKKVNDKWLIDEIGEEIIISSFKDEQQNEQIDEQLLSYMNNEIIGLKEQLKTANDELIKEREFSRTQSNKIGDLAERLAKLNENQQVLLKKEQDRNILMIADEADSRTHQENNKGLFGFLKRQKK